MSQDVGVSTRKAPKALVHFPDPLAAIRGHRRGREVKG